MESIYKKNATNGSRSFLFLTRKRVNKTTKQTLENRPFNAPVNSKKFPIITKVSLVLIVHEGLDTTKEHNRTKEELTLLQ